MDEPSAARDRRGRPGRGCGFGCGGFLIVLTIGIALSLLNTNLGLTASIRIPFTASNASIALSLGTKGKVKAAMPAYVRDRLGGNQNILNQSQTLTIGPAEGAAMLVIGRQDGAPVADLELVAR